MEDRIGLLRRTYLFGGLPDQDLRSIAGLLKERSDRSQGTIYRQGDPDASFYIVVSGRLKVWALDERGRQRVLNYLRLVTRLAPIHSSPADGAT